MRLNVLNIAVPSFVLATSLAAVVVAVTPGSSDNWVINPLTGLAAIAFCFLAFARLSIGAPDAITKRIWMGLIAVFCTVALGQFLEGYDEAIQQVFGIDDVANCVLLVVSPITVWMISRFDPPPLFARGLFVIGFVVQAVSTVLDVTNAILIARWNQDVAFIDLITDFGQFISLQIYLGAVAIFLVSLHLHQLAKARDARTVGDLSRYLIVRLRMLDKLRQPHLAVRVPGIAFCLWLAHFVTWVPIVGPQVRSNHGKGLWLQIIEILRLGISSGMDAQAYYVFEFFHTGALQRSGDYLTHFETRNGLFAAISKFVARPANGPQTPLQDRLKFSTFCTAHHLPCLPILWLSEGGQLEQSDRHLPRHSHDVLLVSRHNHATISTERLFQHIGRGRYLDAAGRTMSSAELFTRAVTPGEKSVGERSLGEGSTGILVPKLVPHPDLARLAGKCTVRFHLVTCLSITKEIQLTHAMIELRSDQPTGATTRDESWFAPIDLDTGIIGTAVLVTDRRRANLPGRRPAINGQPTPLWNAIRQLATDAHAAFRDRFVLAWELICTPDGPVLIGANDHPDVERMQRVSRQPIGDSPLGLHLTTYLQALEEDALNRGTLKQHVIPT